MAEPLAYEGTGYAVVEEEPPELLGRNLVSSSYLLAGATAFFFIAFVFAYFYLRSLNNDHLWRPKHVDPSLTLGTLVMALTVASAIVVRLGLADHRAGNRVAWRRKGGVALALGVAALVLQAIAWTQQGFGPTDGGFASVYFGWTAFLFLFVLGTVLWLEMTLATSIRYRAATGTATPGEASADIRDPLSLVRPSLETLTRYATFLAALGALSWFVLYIL